MESKLETVNVYQDICEILDEDGELWPEMLLRLSDQLAIKFHRDTGVLIGDFLTGGNAGKIPPDEKEKLDALDDEMDKLKDFDHVISQLDGAVDKMMGGKE
tara:strand:+ start:5976 stop:6278 length:303 start_codon:yes stop_codon:yes gene_type:complete